MAIWAIAIGLLFAFGRKSAARELATLIPNLVVLFRGLLGDRRVPRSSKGLLWGGGDLDRLADRSHSGSSSR